MNKQIGKISLALAMLLGSLAASTLASASSEFAASSRVAAQLVSSDDSGMNFAAQILDELNDVRAAMGLSTVKLNPYLTEAAQNHAVYMIANVYYNHDENPHGNYNAKDKSFDITKDSATIHLQIGNKSAIVDGKPITLVTAPFTDKSGTTFVPLRFASEALDAVVTWDAANWTAVIHTNLASPRMKLLNC